jgi:hypothetical protein
MDYLLRFISKAAAEKALFIKETVTIDGEVETTLRPKYAAIDVIGTIYKATGTVTVVDGFDIPEMVAVAGYHANVRHDETATELEQYVVAVNTPARVWA